MKFNGMRTNAGNGPKYVRILPLAIIASRRIASRSIPASPRKKCSACESNASPSTSLTNKWVPPLVAAIQSTTLNASAIGPRGGARFGFRTKAERERRRGWLFFEIEHALFQRVNVAHHEDGNEAEHAPENETAFGDRLFVNDRPGIHEHDFQIEKNEKHRHKVKLHVEARLAASVGHHPAFIWHILGGGPFTGFSAERTDQKRGSSKADGNDHLQEHRQVVAQHPDCEAPMLILARGGRYLPVLWRDCLYQRRGQSFVLFAILLHRTARDQVLQLFIRAQPEHLLPAAGGIAGPQIFMDDVEQFLELERGTTRQYGDQFLRYEVRNSARKCVFLENSHRAANIAHFGRADSIILGQSAPLRRRAEMAQAGAA